MICTRGGCTAPIPEGRQFCSCRCAGMEHARQRGPAYFARIGAKGHRNRIPLSLKPAEEQLMREGKYREAGRSIYERGRSAGWMARHIGSRQRPARKAS